MLLYIKKIQMSINVDLLWLRYSFFRQSQPSMLNETHMMQQIQQLSQTIQKSEELNRQKILQQQQAEFDQQIGHVCAPLNFKFIYINILKHFKKPSIQLSLMLFSSDGRHAPSDAYAAWSSSSPDGSSDAPGVWPCNAPWPGPANLSPTGHWWETTPAPCPPSGWGGRPEGP